MRIRREVIPFVGVAALAGVLAGLALGSARPGVLLFLAGTAGFLFFFRDPDRVPPSDPLAVLAGADGRVMSVTRLMEPLYIHAESVRVSVFLSLFDVHVNRAPIGGHARFLGHFPGGNFPAFMEKASERNQHNKVLIEGPSTRCLVCQIVGPVARRVVYWPSHDEPTPVRAGDRIGMMKFGSRMDVYLPESEVEVLVGPGDRVRAGETAIARARSGGGWA